MTSNTIIKTENFHTKFGTTFVHTFGDGTIGFSLMTSTISLCFPIEDAKAIRDAFDRGINEYEAGIDRYHDICDEPPVPEGA